MSNRKNTDNNVETNQCNPNATQNSNESEPSVHEVSQATNENAHVTSKNQDGNDETNNVASSPKEESVVTEVSSSQAANSWNAINAEVEKQKTQIKGREDNPKQEPEFNFFNELSIRFVKQQDQVISQRKHLLVWFAWITASQLLVINVLIFICIFGNKDTLDASLNFMKFFVGATFLELLGGLLIIVKFVFSHETYDMLKHLTYVEPDAKDL